MRAPYQRVNPVRDKEARKRYLAAMPYCLFCGIADAPWPGLCVHHLIRGSRSDEIANFAVVCGQCHDLCHGHIIRVRGELLPWLTLGAQLNAKRLREPDAWNPARLAELRGQALPALEPIPLWFVEAWSRNRPHEFGALVP